MAQRNRSNKCQWHQIALRATDQSGGYPRGMLELAVEKHGLRKLA
jgi:hypothetical protein